MPQPEDAVASRTTIEFLVNPDVSWTDIQELCRLVGIFETSYENVLGRQGMRATLTATMTFTQLLNLRLRLEALGVEICSVTTGVEEPVNDIPAHVNERCVIRPPDPLIGWVPAETFMNALDDDTEAEIERGDVANARILNEGELRGLDLGLIDDMLGRVEDTQEEQDGIREMRRILDGTRPDLASRVREMLEQWEQSEVGQISRNLAREAQNEIYGQAVTDWLNAESSIWQQMPRINIHTGEQIIPATAPLSRHDPRWKRWLRLQILKISYFFSWLAVKLTMEADD